MSLRTDGWTRPHGVTGSLARCYGGEVGNSLMGVVGAGENKKEKMWRYQIRATF